MSFENPEIVKRALCSTKPFRKNVWDVFQSRIVASYVTTAGAYVDQSTGKLIVTITNHADAAAVRAGGAIPKLVARSAAQLSEVTSARARSARVPGTAWAVDPASNRVVVSADDSVTGSRMSKVRAAAKKMGCAVRIERADRLLEMRVRLAARRADLEPRRVRRVSRLVELRSVAAWAGL